MTGEDEQKTGIYSGWNRRVTLLDRSFQIMEDGFRCPP
jgi:hypothetical protein